ncbi:MAG: prolyl oligopeptidase family serine peptidase [Pseudomonadota bacterium]|nr:prolyl oligopeptidase family serine peptidase [Pseudomonadota bacterium]
MRLLLISLLLVACPAAAQRPARIAIADNFSATRYFKEWRTRVKGDSRFDLESVSPLMQARRLKVPVLIAHGEKDETVAVEQGRQMVKALEDSQANVTSIFYKNGEHDFSDSDDLADFLRRLELFLAKHNPA